MIIQSLAYTHNFCEVVDLIVHCGGKEIYTHLIMAPKNLTYISPEHISNYTDIIIKFVKKPLHSTMKGNRFMFYCDETQDIISVEQLALYTTFVMNGEVKEHGIGLIPTSKAVGTHMSAVKLCQPWKSFQDLDIPIRNVKLHVLT